VPIYTAEGLVQRCANTAVLQYSSACDSNQYCQPPFNYISKFEFLNFSVILALKVLPNAYSDVDKNRKYIRRGGGKRVLLLVAFISKVYWMYL
jgi:hypothetical protein